MPKFKESIGRIKRVFKYVIPPIKRHKGRISISTAVALSVIAMNYLYAYMLTQLYSGLSADEDPEIGNVQIDTVTFAALIGITWFISNSLIASTKDLIITPASTSIGNELAKTYVDTVMHSPYQTFQIANQGDYYTNYFRMRFSIPPSISLTFTDLIPTLANMFVTAGLSVPYGWAGAFLLPVTVAYLGFSFATTESIMKRREDAIKTHNISFELIEKNIKYRALMDSFNKTSSELEALGKSMINALKFDVNATLFVTKMGMIQSIISAIGYTGMMAYYTSKVINNEITVNDFILVSTYLSGYFTSLNLLGGKANLLLTGVTDINFVVNDLIKFEEIVDRNPENHLECTQDNCKINFNHVVFGYKPEIRVIDDLSLTIKPGQKVCFVGPSGSGKSTLSYLLFRLFELNEGAITINKTNIAEISLKSLRDTIGHVPQTTELIPGTLRYNLVYGCQNRETPVTNEELHTVLKNIGLSELIPKLDDEKYGDLSGGQRQRVAIARVLLKNPSIIITDEATSALDAESEMQVQRTMDEVFKGKTTFNITHRLKTAVNADEIYVLVKGKVVEHGTHHDLLQKNGEYASLWNKQENELQVNQENPHRLFSKDKKGKHVTKKHTKSQKMEAKDESKESHHSKKKSKLDKI